ncbi:MAG: hypothetical protein IJI56_06875, partial [Firmicutes bacterium]|nr:hypothetical protein [Bacillota bacterium]
MENENEFYNLEQTGDTVPEADSTPIFSEAEEAALNDATVVVAAADSELGNGVGEAVIDRDEWNKIVAEVDAKQTEAAKEAEELKKK